MSCHTQDLGEIITPWGETKLARGPAEVAEHSASLFGPTIMPFAELRKPCCPTMSSGCISSSSLIFDGFHIGFPLISHHGVEWTCPMTPTKRRRRAWSSKQTAQEKLVIYSTCAPTALSSPLGSNDPRSSALRSLGHMGKLPGCHPARNSAAIILFLHGKVLDYTH